MLESRVQYYEINGQRIPMSPDGIPMLNLAKPVVKPDLLLIDQQKPTKRNSTGVKGFIMGDTQKKHIPGSRAEQHDGDDPLAYVVDIIVSRREDQVILFITTHDYAVCTH